jgi:hypothetical protein
MDPEVLKRAAQERAKIGVADEDFHRNVAVIKFERDGQVGYIAAANVPEALHSEEALIGKLNDDDPGMAKTRILELFSEREPCTSKCKPLLERQRAKMKYDFPLHHWVPEKGTLGERAELLRGKYQKEGVLPQLAPTKGPVAAPEPEVSAKTSVPKGKSTSVPKGKSTSVPKGKSTSVPKAKNTSPGPRGMGLKKSPGPLKGPIINFGIGIGAALLTSLMHDAILNSVQAMPHPTLETVKIWSRDGMGKAGPLDLAGADLEREIEAFESGRGQLTSELVVFWRDLDNAPPAELAKFITAAEDAIWADQGILVEADRNVTAALAFREQIMEGVTAAAELHALIDNPLVMKYLMDVGLRLEEILKIRDNLAWYQAVFTRGVVEPLDRLYVRINEAMEANDQVLAQLKARRARERRRPPGPASPPVKPSTSDLITIEPPR